jgi:2-polyprenyl-3-methyl-5-hydroxy-6-metoxy-1,4-benzoquinol methylase
MKKINCLICGKNNNTLLHTFDSIKNPKIKGLKVVRCNHCGFVFMNPQPSLKELITFYPDSLHESKRKSRLRFLKELYEKIRLRQVLHEAKNHPKNILDIGCSNGFFLELAKSKGLKIYGTEFGKNQINYLKKNLTKNIYASERELIGNVKFDIITAFDVIEHLQEPEEFIKNCSKLLKEDGLLVVMTMVLDSWSYKTFKGKVSWLSDQHLFYFTRGNFKKLLERNGLEVYKTRTYNKSLLHLVLFVYQLISMGKAEFADNVIFFIKRKNENNKHIPK